MPYPMIQNKLFEHLSVNSLQTPVWVFDIERMTMLWGNEAALKLWDAPNLEQLVNRNWGDYSESTHIRLNNYLEKFKRGETIIEQWTFYPNNAEPISTQCFCSGLKIEGDRLVMVLEAYLEPKSTTNDEPLRAIEVVRHTKNLISLYSGEGICLMQNPSALRAYGDDKKKLTPFQAKFVDPNIATEAINYVATRNSFSKIAQVMTTKGIRCHRIDISSINDPVTGKLMMLVQEKDLIDISHNDPQQILTALLLEGVAKATNHLLNAKDYNAGITTALEAIGLAADVDRVYVFQNETHPTSQEKMMILRWQWYNAAVVSATNYPQLEEYLSRDAKFPRWYYTLSEGQSIQGVVEKFSSMERDFLVSRDVKSILIMPIFIEDKFWGLIGFDDCQVERQWSESEKLILIAAVGSIGGVIRSSEAYQLLSLLNNHLEQMVAQRTADLRQTNSLLLHEIEQREKIQEELRYNAFHDSLTKLPNRAWFMLTLEEALKEYLLNHKKMFAVFFLDLDRFKVINDSLGHRMGDRLLIEIAQRLSHCLKETDLVARLGGDEFAILLRSISNLEEATKIAKNLLSVLSKPFVIQGHNLFTSASIGIALSSLEYQKPEELLRDADIVMYRAKEQGKSRYEVFDSKIHEIIKRQLRLENDLQNAVKLLLNQRRGANFEIYYQPMVLLSKGKIAGFEALIRWKHPELGLISPGEFISIAEETGLIVALGDWLLKTACEQIKAWELEFPNSELICSVNISGRQLLQQGIISLIQGVLDETGVNPEQLKLEITETVLLNNSDLIKNVLFELKKMNLKLCIDDFGTGYSSLSYIHEYPIDVIKIDRAFVTQMGKGSKNLAIVKTIINLAHNLGLSVIAEGLETQEQLIMLRSLECHLGQGYLFSKPVTKEAATMFLRKEYL